MHTIPVCLRLVVLLLVLYHYDPCLSFCLQPQELHLSSGQQKVVSSEHNTAHVDDYYPLTNSGIISGSGGKSLLQSLQKRPYEIQEYILSMTLLLLDTSLSLNDMMEDEAVIAREQGTVAINSGTSPITSTTVSSLLLAQNENNGNTIDLSSRARTDLEQDVMGHLTKLKMERDEVVRVLDANTVKLKKSGLVSLAGVQTPSGYKGGSGSSFSECLTVSPSRRIKQLLPASTVVRVRFIGSSADSSGSSNPKRPAIVQRENDGILLNTELVRSGFAKSVQRNREEVERLLPGMTELLTNYQSNAKQNELGLYQTCTTQTEGAVAMVLPPDDQFEPLEYSVETIWGDDGGKQVVRQRGGEAERQPSNPGDTKGCSDFETYEGALRWYETYFPWYGDVAKLDPDKDGIPCPGLPHTTNQNRYRMKVPSSAR